MSKKLRAVCSACKQAIPLHKNPIPTVDIIIEMEDNVILIERKNFPYGWAIPGGFVDYGETVENAAIREAKEETSLDVHSIALLGVYSDPNRDPRHHTVSTVFVARAKGTPKAADDAKKIALFQKKTLPSNLAFDHEIILHDYFRWKKTQKDHRRGRPLS